MRQHGHIRRKAADRKAAGKAAADKGKWEKALAVDEEFSGGVAMRPVLRGRGPTFLAREEVKKALVEPRSPATVPAFP